MNVLFSGSLMLMDRKSHLALFSVLLDIDLSISVGEAGSLQLLLSERDGHLFVNDSTGLASVRDVLSSWRLATVWLGPPAGSYDGDARA